LAQRPFQERPVTRGHKKEALGGKKEAGLWGGGGETKIKKTSSRKVMVAGDSFGHVGKKKERKGGPDITFLVKPPAQVYAASKSEAKRNRATLVRNGTRGS